MGERGGRERRERGRERGQERVNMESQWDKRGGGGGGGRVMERGVGEGGTENKTVGGQILIQERVCT